MIDITPNSRVYKLYSILISYCENRDQQAECSEVFNDWVQSETDSKVVERYIASAIFNGLAYGNWIWSDPLMDWNKR